MRRHPSLAYLETLREAYNLLTICDDISKHKVKNLNKKKKAIYKATIIHICAAWETFLEAVIEDALNCILTNASKANQIPISVLLRITTRLNTGKDQRLIWNISDDGWKREMTINFELLKAKFNTPRPDNIEEFFSQTIGIKNIPGYWYWKGFSKKNAIDKLNSFMDLRGDLTHRLISNQDVYDHILIDYINFLYRVSTVICNVIRTYTYEIVKVHPWKELPIEKLL